MGQEVSIINFGFEKFGSPPSPIAEDVVYTYTLILFNKVKAFLSTKEYQNEGGCPISLFGEIF